MDTRTPSLTGAHSGGLDHLVAAKENKRGPALIQGAHSQSWEVVSTAKGKVCGWEVMSWGRGVTGCGLASVWALRSLAETPPGIAAGLKGNETLKKKTSVVTVSVSLAQEKKKR